MSENSVTAEGQTVNEAIAAAAAALGVEAAMVDHKIDVSHFRNEDGRVISRDTVKIIAKVGDPDEMKARAEKRRAQLEAAAASRSDDGPRGRGDDRRPRRRREERPAYDGDDSGAVAGKEWLEGLFGHMGIEATLSARAVAENEAVIDINSPSARHLVGRRGSNLRAIRALFGAVMAQTGQEDWHFELNVEGGRDRDDRRRDDRRDRDDRRRGDRRSDRDMEKLRRLASRLADQAVESGEAVRIRRELNSYERRAVHVALADDDRVETRSDGDGSHKTVVIFPAGSEE